MKTSKLIWLLGFLWLAAPAGATLDGDLVTGQLSNAFTTQIYSNSTATVGVGDEFVGYQSVSTMGNILQHYADLDDATITIGVRHIGTTGFIFSANALTYEFSGLDWSGPGAIQSVVLDSAFAQQLWPSDMDPNAHWIGWGQDTPTPPAWEPGWDPAERKVTVVATDGFVIPPGYDVWAKFRLVVPEPSSAMLLAAGAMAAAIFCRRRAW